MDMNRQNCEDHVKTLRFEMFFAKRRRDFYSRRLSYWKNEFPQVFVDKTKKTESINDHSLINVMKDYAKYCSLHGIQYVFKENSTLIEK